MHILIHHNSTVIKVLIRDMTLFFHNTQVVVEIPDDTLVFFPARGHGEYREILPPPLESKWMIVASPSKGNLELSITQTRKDLYRAFL